MTCDGGKKQEKEEENAKDEKPQARLLMCNKRKQEETNAKNEKKKKNWYIEVQFLEQVSDNFACTKSEKEKGRERESKPQYTPTHTQRAIQPNVGKGVEEKTKCEP